MFPIVIGMVAMYYTSPENEPINFIDSFYWSAATCATIGYGDIVPVGDLNRLWVSAYIFLGVTCMSAAIAQIGTLQLTIKTYKRLEVVQNKQLALSLIAQLDSKGLGVDKFEFLAAMLVALEKVGPEDVTGILSQFDELDKSRRGLVSINDIVELKRRNELPTVFTIHKSGRTRPSSTSDCTRNLPQLEPIHDDRGMHSLEERFGSIIHNSRETTNDPDIGGVGPLTPRH
jgi:hypothetical protein